jgi:hypothetical protein
MQLNRLGVTRFVAIMVGAAVVYGLGQWLGVSLFIAIPVATVAYIVTLVVVGLLLGADPQAK